jgi:hypothetical protein
MCLSSDDVHYKYLLLLLLFLLKQEEVYSNVKLHRNKQLRIRQEQLASGLQFFNFFSYSETNSQIN